MRFLHLHVKNFRGIRQADLKDLPPAVFLTGPNGACKTSILDAVRVLCFGRAFDALGREIKTADLVGDWGDEAVAAALVSVGGERLRLEARIRKGETKYAILDENRQPRFPGGSDAQREALWKLAGAPLKQSEFACSTRAYLYGAEFAELMGRLFASLHPVASVAKANPERRAFLEAAVKKSALAPSTPEQWQAFGDHCSKTRRALKDERTTLDRQLRAPDLLDLENPTGKNGPIGVDQLAECRETQARLKTARDKLAGRIKAQAERPDPEAQRERLCVQIESVETRVQALQEARDKAERAHAIAAAGDNGRAAPNDLLAQARENWERAKHAEEAAAGFALEKAEALNAAREAQQDAAAALEEAERGECPCRGACPKCSGKVDGQTLKAAVKQTAQALRDADAAVTEALQKSELAQLTHTEEKAALEKAQAALESIEQQDRARREAGERAREEARTALDTAAAEYNRARGELEALQRQLEALPGAAPEGAPAQDVEEPETVKRPDAERLKDADKRLARGAEIIAVLERIERRETLKARLDAIDLDIENLTWAVEQFQKGAYFAPFVEKQVKGLEEACGAFLAPNNRALTFRVEGKACEALLSKDGRRALPLALCSKGERVMAEFSVAMVLASHYAERPGAVVLDDFDALDARAKAQLWESLQDLYERVGTVFVASAWGLSTYPDWYALNSFLDPARVFWCEDGGVSVEAPWTAEEEAQL